MWNLLEYLSLSMSLLWFIFKLYFCYCNLTVVKGKPIKVITEIHCIIVKINGFLHVLHFKNKNVNQQEENWIEIEVETVNI